MCGTGAIDQVKPDSDIRFRDAQPADLAAIARIHSDAWHAAYRDLIAADVLARVTPATRLAAWQQWFSDADHRVIVLVDDNRILGFIRLCPPRLIASPPPNYGELSHLYLDPSVIAKGYGHALFDHAKRTLESCGYAGMLLWTLEGNRPARRFYERHGMHTDGAREDEPDWLGPGVYEVRYILPFNAG